MELQQCNAITHINYRTLDLVSIKIIYEIISALQLLIKDDNHHPSVLFEIRFLQNNFNVYWHI